VDRTVIKNASLNRAKALNIEARSLPIRPFMKQRSCLNLDHIVMIMCKFMEVKDWKLAFEHGAPKRKSQYLNFFIPIFILKKFFFLFFFFYFF
jgi:hypothetical protein